MLGSGPSSPGKDLVGQSLESVAPANVTVGEALSVPGLRRHQNYHRGGNNLPRKLASTRNQDCRSLARGNTKARLLPQTGDGGGEAVLY